MFTTVAVAFMILLLAAAAELALRVTRGRARAVTTEQAVHNDCDSLMLLTLGDSMTWGLGADHETESYPARLPEQIKRHLKVLPVQTINLGVPGTNTSEGISMLDRFFSSHPDNTFDYALILYGVNNRWNLHDATFWEWDERAKDENYGEYLASRLQIDKVFDIARQNRADAGKKLTDVSGTDFRSALDEHGWSMFFDSFEDDLLKNWIRHDLTTMMEHLRARGVRPVLLTYHYERFGHLNDIIRKLAAETSTPLLDIEQNPVYWATRRMFDDDGFHLNAKGYNLLARNVADAFINTVGRDAVWQRWQDKAARCRATPAPPASAPNAPR